MNKKNFNKLILVNFLISLIFSIYLLYANTIYIQIKTLKINYCIYLITVLVINIMVYTQKDMSVGSKAIIQQILFLLLLIAGMGIFNLIPIVELSPIPYHYFYFMV